MANKLIEAVEALHTNGRGFVSMPDVIALIRKHESAVVVRVCPECDIADCAKHRPQAAMSEEQVVEKRESNHHREALVWIQKATAYHPTNPIEKICDVQNKCREALGMSDED